MKLAWVFCLLLAGKLSTATPADESTPGESNMGSSSYMMAFPMDDDQVAEETAQEAVKMLAESLVSDDDDDESTDDSEDKKPEETVTEETKEDQTEQPEPAGILQAELEAEEAEKPSLPQRPFFKRPKMEELRKILGFPPNEGAAAKTKPIPAEKPKVFQGLFSKPRPKLDVSPQPSPLGGLQFNLRREDRMRPFGFPMLPLKRDDGFRPFGIPDLVQAASSLLRRAIVDENNENDISKDDKEEEENVNENNQEDNDDDEEEDESLMIVPIPDSKENNMERPPLFRRFPIPLPFSLPNKPAQQQSRPRLPFPPLTPVAFFLPIAQQIMQNIRHAQPRSQPPMMPIHPPRQNFVPIHTQIPIMPAHHMPQQQQIIPMPTQQHQFIPMPSQQQHQFIPMPQPMFQQQQFIPIFHVPQASYQTALLTPLPPNMQQRPIMRQMPRRMPMHAPQPQIMQQRQPRRLSIPQPISRVAAPHPMAQQIISRPIHAANTRPMQRAVRPPMPPVNPILFMMPVPNMPMPMAQQHMPVYQKPQHIPMMPQHRQMMAAPEEERVIFVRPDQEEQDDDQEVLILVPSDEVEMAQRPPVMPQQFLRQVPTPVISPLQKIRLLRDLLMARQANRQAAMVPQNRPPRVVEIVQQQLRIFPAHHQQQQPQMIHPQFQRAEPSELHPVYVPYPGPQ